jgi:hypothetical protein
MASTTPPPPPPSPDPPRGPAFNFPEGARLPIPGNAEIAVWIVSLIVAAIVVAIADKITNVAWFDYFKWTTVAYLLSRGIAKASRVLEQ